MDSNHTIYTKWFPNMNIPLRSEYDQNPRVCSSRSELCCKHLPQRPAGFHGVTFQWQNQFSPIICPSLKRTHCSLCSRTGRNDSTVCIGCSPPNLDSHEKTASRPKSSDVFHEWFRVRLLAHQPKSENVYAGLFWRPFSSNSNPVLSVSRVAKHAHMKIMKIYRENISLTINPPTSPEPPFTSWLNISGWKHESRVQSWKFKVLWIIVKYSFMSESILKCGLVHLLGLSHLGKQVENSYMKYSRTSQIFTLDRKM